MGGREPRSLVSESAQCNKEQSRRNLFFVPFCLVLSHFVPYDRGLVPQAEGALSLGRVVIFNVIVTKAGTSTSAQRGSREGGNDEKGRSDGSTFNLTTAGGPGQTRRSAPTMGDLPWFGP